MQVTCPQYHPQQRNRQWVPLGQVLAFPPSWSHPRDTASGVSIGGHQPLLLSPARQPSSSPHGNLLPVVPAPLALPDRQAPTIEAQPQHPWPPPVSLNMPGQGTASNLQQLSPAMSLPPVQVPASIRGKIQHSGYINLSELLAYDFQYRYSGLDDSQALEMLMASSPLPLSAKPGTYLLYSWGSGLGTCTKIFFLFSIPTGTWSSPTTSVTLQT